MATIENPTDPIPPNRWEQSEPHERGYGRKFRQLVEQGQDIHGEARLADALIARCLVLDAGSGMGRVGARLRELGHEVTAVEKDPELVAMSRELYPDLPVIEQDLLAISPAQLLAHGRPTAYDLVVLVGNVMILLAPDTERRALSTVAAVLRPGGRLLVGFHPAGGGPAHGRHYPPAEFASDAQACGLVVEHQLGGYSLEPINPDYAVWVLRKPAAGYEGLTSPALTCARDHAGLVR